MSDKLHYTHVNTLSQFAMIGRLATEKTSELVRLRHSCELAMEKICDREIWLTALALRPIINNILVNRSDDG